ncbi:DDE 3 domain containing protein [Asbolus verrucosus]|uniref:DDE 3 domain containing protein n=1 Tax=Asbolus verrucosus TaxID=1661398 RepID=A0A482VTI6_ASBVE|nr:DDE 3 domain containing protein [Asbolus verrucosus]
MFQREHKSFILKSYFRYGQKLENEQWLYSIPSCIEEFHQRFPNFPVTYQQLNKQIHKCVDLFKNFGTVTRKEGSGQPMKRTAENIQDVEQRMDRSPKKSIRKLSQKTQLSYGTCQLILKKDLYLYPYKISIILTTTKCWTELFLQTRHGDSRTVSNDLLQPVIEQLHDDEITQGFFQQDNATSHKTHATIEFLMNEFYDERIVNFPPRSPDVAILDYYVFPHLKNTIF